jgi:uncharacterized protein
MTRVVLDANVLISALLNPEGAPGRVVDLWHGQRFLLIAADGIVAEFVRVAREPKLRRYGLVAAEAERFAQSLHRFAVFVPCELDVAGAVRDPGDEKYLACAVEGRADYIVSGDSDLLSLLAFRGIPILSPAAFLESLPAEE